MATVLAEDQPTARFVLVDSDLRKCAFLREVARTLGLTVVVVAGRIEDIEPLNATVVSARALAPLPCIVHNGASPPSRRMEKVSS